jgi:hypothetical protein
LALQAVAPGAEPALAGQGLQAVAPVKLDQVWAGQRAQTEEPAALLKTPVMQVRHVVELVRPEPVL